MHPKHEDLNFLAEEFLAAWKEAHGFDAGQAKVLVGPERLAILIEGAFSKAERILAQDTEGEMLLRKYAVELLQLISDDMTDRIEVATGRIVKSSDVSVTHETDQILFIFSFD